MLSPTVPSANLHSNSNPKTEKIDYIRLANEYTFKKAIGKGEDGEIPVKVKEEFARQRRLLLIYRIIENEPSFFIRMKLRIRLFCMYILNRE